MSKRVYRSLSGRCDRAHHQFAGRKQSDESCPIVQELFESQPTWYTAMNEEGEEEGSGTGA
jgi:hypothetical protein